VETLSAALTSGLESDSEKVRAIHTWITHNIRYDVKKFIRFDYEHVPVKRILRKRKAVCVGYSDLFNELCRYAGIKSVTVPGYTKNINVDIIDTFYMDDHTWNAVEINGVWMPVDATWDAGYIKYDKSTLWGLFLRLVTNGKTDQVHFKPHFKKSPSEDYFLTNTFFAINHLALNPLWQLSSPATGISHFRDDSSYYFKRYNRETIPGVVNDGKGAARDAYYNLDIDHREIEDGFAGIRFNFRNHYAAGNAWRLQVKEEVEVFDFTSIDTAAQLREIGEILSHIDSGIVHLDSNAIYLTKQRDELNLFNREKHNLCGEKNKLLLYSSKKTWRAFIKTYQQSRFSFLACFRVARRVHGDVNGLRKGIHFHKETGTARKTRLEDSLDIEKKLTTIDDSLQLKREKITLGFQWLDSAGQALVLLHKRYHSGSLMSSGLLSGLVYARLQYYDDFDYEIRRQADNLAAHKLSNDSLLLKGDLSSAYLMLRELKKTRNDIRTQVRFCKRKSSLFCQLKSRCAPNTTIAARYNAEMPALADELDEFSAKLKDWGIISFYLKREYRRFVKDAKREGLLVYKEKRVENSLHKVRAKHISRHYKALNRITRSKRAGLESEKRRLEALKVRLEKK
jgi:hypothetical protein